VASEGNSGSLTGTEKDSLSASPSRDMCVSSEMPASANMDGLRKPAAPPLPGGPLENLTGGEHAASNHKAKRGMQMKRKAESAGEDGLACKAPRHSESQQVGGLVQPCLQLDV
jgi:hypothetical protein